MYKNILIATDGSEVAGRAVAHAIALAADQKAEVTVMTVTEMWSAVRMAERARLGSQNPFGEYESAAAAAARAILTRAEEAAKAAGVSCNSIHVPDQQAADAIAATAKERGCDLIVMGSRGHRGLNKILVGSRVQEVLIHCDVPILVVH
mgnify:CR=1 FL=1